MKNLFGYLLFLGIYILLFTFIQFTTLFSVDFLVAALVSYIGMITVFIAMREWLNHYSSPTFFQINFLFVFFFSLLTIGYNQTYGLTNVESMSNGTTLFSNSQFYERTLSVNHSIILGTLTLTIYSLIRKRWKNLGICLLTLILIFGYVYLIV